MNKSTQSFSESVAHPDQFSLTHFYVWMALGAPIYCFHEIDRLTGLSYFLGLLTSIPALIITVFFIARVLNNLWSRRWKALASVVFAPLMTIAVFGTLSKFQINPDWVHFELARASYLRQVRESPGVSPKRLKWYWGETGSATGPNIDETLVFDEADKPLSMLTPVTKNPSVRRMGDHFYLVTEVW